MNHHVGNKSDFEKRVVIVWVNLVVLSAIVLCYYDVVIGLVKSWSRNPNNSHGFLVPLVSLYLIWMRRKEWKDADFSFSLVGLLIFLVGGFLQCVGRIASAHTTLRLSLMISLGGSILFIWGREAFKIIRFPYFYSFLMIPVPAYFYDLVAFPLKSVVAKGSVIVMRFIGMSVAREGNVILLPHVRVEVVEACSGIRSITALVAVVILYLYFYKGEWWKKGIIFLSILPVEIVTNGLRVILTGYISENFGTWILGERIHAVLGVVSFVFMCGVIVVIGNILGAIPGKSIKTFSRR